jgi:hypothetical protein
MSWAARWRGTGAGGEVIPVGCPSFLGRGCARSGWGVGPPPATRGRACDASVKISRQVSCAYRAPLPQLALRSLRMPLAPGTPVRVSIDIASLPTNRLPVGCRRYGGVGAGEAADARVMQQQLEASLKRLGRRRLDLQQVWNPGGHRGQRGPVPGAGEVPGEVPGASTGLEGARTDPLCGDHHLGAATGEVPDDVARRGMLDYWRG